jgi:hypothetical protein
MNVISGFHNLTYPASHTGETGAEAGLPDEFHALPHRRTVYLTLGTIVNDSAGAFDAALARAGAGIALTPGERTADAIRDAVARVLDEPSFARGARTLQDEMAATPSADETLEELIGLRSNSTALVGR